MAPVVTAKEVNTTPPAPPPPEAALLVMVPVSYNAYKYNKMDAI